MSPRECRLSGVNYAGFLSAPLGIGEAARGYVEALRRMGLDVACVDTEEFLPGLGGPRPSKAIWPLRSTDYPHPVNIVHINPDLLHRFWLKAGHRFFRGRYTIGIWAWETPVFPPRWYNRFRLVDEIWVGGGYMARGISMASPVPVLVMPHGVEPPAVPPDRERFGLPMDEFIFLFSFDFHSSLVRKNPHGVIEAFRAAFRPEEPARLVIKSINGASLPQELQCLRDLCRGLRVTFLDRVLSGPDRTCLLASCDAYVSLHRAEGFGLGIAEAMALGKPVIATGYSGNMDFMDVGNSFPVRFRLEPLEEADPPYDKGSLWAAPDLEDASRNLRWVFEHRDAAEDTGQRARKHLQQHNAFQVIGERMVARLTLIQGNAFRKRRGGRREHLAGFRARMHGTRFLLGVWMGLVRILPRAWRPGLRRLTERSRSRMTGML